MNKKALFWIVIALAGWVVLGATSHKVSTADQEGFQAGRQSISQQLLTQTPIPTVSPTLLVTDTPAPRVLPPVGDNAGVVCGASILVLIIIGGVVLSSRRKK
jgi:hypothetical protein